MRRKCWGCPRPGVYVVSVVPGGPADQGGMRGDGATDNDMRFVATAT